MTLAATRRIPAPLSVLTALVVLTLSTALALVGAPGHAASPADGSFSLEITADVVIKSDDTYSIKMVVTDSTGLDIFNKENCKAESFAGADVGKVDAKADFKEEGDKAICTIEGSGPIKDSDGQIKHEGKEYVVKLGNEESWTSPRPSPSPARSPRATAARSKATRSPSPTSTPTRSGAETARLPCGSGSSSPWAR